MFDWGHSGFLVRETGSVSGRNNLTILSWDEMSFIVSFISLQGLVAAPR